MRLSTRKHSVRVSGPANNARRPRIEKAQDLSWAFYLWGPVPVGSIISQLRFVVDDVKAMVGCTYRFRPTYAGANVGHPSCSLRVCFGVRGTAGPSASLGMTKESATVHKEWLLERGVSKSDGGLHLSFSAHVRWGERGGRRRRIQGFFRIQKRTGTEMETGERAA
jgi:hypothetical protein